MKISFTRQLMQLRENEVDKVTFPSNLTNIERKFLHKLSDELGLKSKSLGQGEDRAITVTKPAAAAVAAKQAAAAANGGNGNGNQGAPPPPVYKMHPRTLDLLSHTFTPAQMEAALRDSRARDAGEGAAPGKMSAPRRITADRVYKATSLSADMGMIQSAYLQAQQKRDIKPEYVRVREKRRSLPAAEHEKNVCDLIKTHQIVLVSGETGCGKTTQVSNMPFFIFQMYLFI